MSLITSQKSSLLLPTLRDMFPTLPDDVLLAALDAHGNQIEGAIVSLLEMCADEAGASETLASVKDIHRGDSSRNPSTSPPDCASLMRDLQCGTATKHHPPAKAVSSTRPAPTACVQQRPHTDVSSTHRKTWGQLRALQQLQQQPVHKQCQQQHEQQQQHHHHPAPLSSLGQAAKPNVSGAQREWQNPRYISPAAARANVKLAAADFPDLPPASAPGTARHASDPHEPHRGSGGSGPGASVAQGGVSRRGTATTARTCAPGQSPSPPISPAQRGPQSYGRGTTCGYVQAARWAPQAMRAIGSWPRLAAADGDVYDCDGGRDGSGMVYDNGRYAAAASDGGGEAEGWQEAAVEELCRSHCWAGRDLVEAVCIALQYDLSEVVSALDELHAASYQDCRTGASGRSCSASPSSSVSESGCSSSDSGAEEDASKWEDDGQLQRRQRPHANGTRAAPSIAAAAAAGSYDDFAAEAGFPRGPGGGSGGGGGSHRARRKGGAGADGSGGDVGDNAYSRHRCTALKLTHAWRKRMSKASVAFSRGDRALGRQLVAEAQLLRRQAAAAHEEAAQRIEQEMNSGRQLSEWELDLHGLHAEEAVQALARRIAALETGAAPHGAATTTTAVTITTTMTATAAEPSRAKPRAAEHAALQTAAPSSNTPSEFSSRRRRKPAAAMAGAHSAAAFGAAAAAATAAAAPAPITPSSKDSSQCQVLGSRRVLRVIVGKGLHSSGGEASLPRVVEGYLLQRGYRFTPRAGVIEVQLRRQFAASAAAAVTMTAQQ